MSRKPSTIVLNIPREDFLRAIADVVSNETKVASITRATKKPKKKTKRTPSAERLKQLAEAREAYFKKMGFGKYAKAS